MVYLVRPFSIDVHNKSHPTSIFFEAWMVESFCFRQSPTFLVKGHSVKISNGNSFSCCFTNFFSDSFVLQKPKQELSNDVMKVELTVLTLSTGWQFTMYAKIRNSDFALFLPLFSIFLVCSIWGLNQNTGISVSFLCFKFNILETWIVSLVLVWISL